MQEYRLRMAGLTITAVDADVDYLGIEIHASNDRFAGSTWVYARVTELSELADEIKGFPRAYEDHRAHEFGTRNPSAAGGFCSITLRCLDRSGHVGVDIVVEDDDGRYTSAQAQFSFQTEAAAVDQFTEGLRIVGRDRRGSVSLAGA